MAPAPTDDNPTHWQRFTATVSGALRKMTTQEEESPIFLQRLASKPTKPTLLGNEALTAKESHMDERIRTLCLVILASAVVAAALHYLRNVLVPLVLALALKYLLIPLINVLSCESCANSMPCRVPRPIATIFAFGIAFGILGVLGAIVTRSIGEFTSHADVYRGRVEEILSLAFNATRSLQEELGLEMDEEEGGAPLDPTTTIESVKSFVKHLSVTDVLLSVLGSAATVAEDIMYVSLFLVFMLAGYRHRERRYVKSAVDEQIFAYIRGKVAISLVVAVDQAIVLCLVGLDLWLVFGVLAFWLNFIPNVGMFTAVCLPMPLIALDPSFTPPQIAAAFLVPLCVGMVAKDVGEPMVLGKQTSLQPVAVLLAIMLWGSVWGLTGMILAVPVTAVLRIQLESVDHPVPRYIASVLAGSHNGHGAAHSPSPASAPGSARNVAASGSAVLV